jgi:hypothetical protein
MSPRQRQSFAFQVRTPGYLVRDFTLEPRRRSIGVSQQSEEARSARPQRDLDCTFKLKGGAA